MLSLTHSYCSTRLSLVDIARLFTFGSAVAFSMLASSLADASTRNAGITRQAVIEKHFKYADKSNSRARLFYNDHGYRLIPLSEGNEFELIVNTINDTVSIFDLSRKIITEIDLTLEFSSGPQLITLPQIRRLVKLPGQLDSTPCLINGGHKTGLFIVEGLELEVWSCNEESDGASSGFNDEVTKQHYSVEQGRVVYSLFSDGVEYHMRDIQRVKSEVMFTKPANFRNASIEEFFGIVKPIGVYSPSASSQALDNVAKVKR